MTEPIVLEIKLADETDKETLLQLLLDAEMENEFGSPVSCRVLQPPHPHCPLSN
jgi:hypothetical protein